MSICAECKQVNGRTCCELPEGSVPSMPLSLDDVKRIEKASGLKFNEFVVCEQSELSKGLHAGNTILRLTVVKGGPGLQRCVFLGDMGCILPQEAKPVGCTLYPFGYDEMTKSLRVEATEDHSCLMFQRANGDPEKLRELLAAPASKLIKLGVQRAQEAERHERLLGG